jgi:hypothetical protein
MYTSSVTGMKLSGEQIQAALLHELFLRSVLGVYTEQIIPKRLGSVELALFRPTIELFHLPLLSSFFCQHIP